MVVFIHAAEYNRLGTYFRVISTCAVPFFFLISGYYLSLNISAGKMDYLSRQLKKMWKLFIFTNLLYALFISALILIFHDDLAGFWKKSLSIKSIIIFLVFNQSPFCNHLWYIGAQLYVLIIFALFIMKNKFKTIVIYMPYLLFGNIVMGIYSKVFLNHSFPIYVARNFIGVGIPFIAIGYMLPVVIGKNRHLHKYVLPSIIIFSMAIILERLILYRLDLLSTGDVFIMTVPFTVSMFIFAATDEHAHSSLIMKILADIGRYDSANIYIYHMIYISILKYISISKNIIYIYSKPFLIFVLALALSKGLRFTKSHFLKHKQ